MPDALQQALDNAAYNSPKGEELHLKNLDDIADPKETIEFGTWDATLKDNHAQNLSAFQQEQIAVDYQSAMQERYISQSIDIKARVEEIRRYVENETLTNQVPARLARIESVCQQKGFLFLGMRCCGVMYHE